MGTRWLTRIGLVAVLVASTLVVAAEPASPASVFNFYTSPPQYTETLVTGPDGALWFGNELQNTIGRMTTSGQVTNYPGPGIDLPYGITVGSDGALWFTNIGNSSIGRITTSGEVTNYTHPGIGYSLSITAGPDGALWFASRSNGAIGRITTGESPVVTMFTDPELAQADYITAGPDGALWFTASGSSFADAIGRITTSGDVTMFPLGTEDQALKGIVAGPDGALWFTDNEVGEIGRITTTGQVTRYPIPGFGQPEGITVGPDGALWFADEGHYAIGRITTLGQITLYPGAAEGVDSPIGITAGPDGALWFANPTTDVNAATIGRFQLVPGIEIAAVNPPPAQGGVAYSLTLSASGGTAPYKWKKIGKLPRGLKLNARTGEIYGTPKGKTTGTFTFTVQARYKTKLPKQKAVWHTASRALSITVI